MISFKNVLTVLLISGGMVLSTSAVAGVVWAEDITISMGAPTFYTMAGGFAVNAVTPQTADIRVFDAVEYDYRIDNAVVTFTPCALQWTNSTGTIAEGKFAGGATLTVTGDLIYEPTETVYLTGGTIFEADMVLSSSETWILIEDAFMPNRFGASIDFVPADGGLNTGIAVGDGDVLRLGDFNLGFSATNVQAGVPAINNFNVPFMLGPQTSLQIIAVPEPCTILLMAFGSVGLLRRNRKK